MNLTEAKTLIELLAEASNAWYELWTVFYTVGAAMVGIIASGKILPKSRTFASAMVVCGFLIFAIGNYLALEQMRQQREALIKYAENEAKESGELLTLIKASAPTSKVCLRFYHWSLSLFVVVLLVLIPRFLSAAKGAQSSNSE